MFDEWKEKFVELFNTAFGWYQTNYNKVLLGLLLIIILCIL
jgi:hypothetical protein